MPGTRTRQEFLYERAPFPSCHAGTLAETSPGRFTAAWFGGEREGAPDVGIWVARNEGAGWSEPRRVAAHEGVPCWNPVLHQCARGPLLLFYHAGPSPMTWSCLLCRSEDEGRTWSPPELLPAGILGPIKNKPLELADGTLVCGSSVESWRAWSCWVEITPDRGRTWSKHGPIAMEGHPMGIIQPGLFPLGEGGVGMLCRTRDLPHAVRAESRDGGRTWNPPVPVALPQNNSGLDTVRLRDGRLVVIYNHTTRGRTPLNLAVSGDDGFTWIPGPVLESEPGEYSYPAILQGAGGEVHAVYTWRRERMRHAVIPLAALPLP